MSISINELRKNIDMDGDGQMDPEEKEILDLLISMDVDGDGTIGIRELVKLGDTLNQSKEQVGQLKKIAIAVICLSFLFCGVMFVVCFAAVEAAKDAKPSDSGKLETVATHDSDAVAVSVDGNIEVVGIDELYSLAPDTLKQVTEIGFQLGETYYDWNVVGFEQTIDGKDISVKFNLDGGDYVMCTDSSVDLYQMATGASIDVLAAENSRKMKRRALLAASGRSLLQGMEDECGAFCGGVNAHNTIASVTEAMMDNFVSAPMDMGEPSCPYPSEALWCASSEDCDARGFPGKCEGYVMECNGASACTMGMEMYPDEEMEMYPDMGRELIEQGFDEEPWVRK